MQRIERRTPDVTGSGAERVRLQRFLTASAVWLVGLVLLPAEVTAVWYAAFLLGTYALVIKRVFELEQRLRRPVALLVAAAGLSIVGGMIRELLSDGNGAPVPSIADPLLFASTLIFLWAIVTIIRGRNPRVGMDPTLDAGVATVAVALLQWTVVLLPQLQSSELSAAGKVTNILFGCLALAYVGAAVLALVAGSVPTTSNRLLATGLVATVVLDSTYTLASFGRVPEAPLSLVAAVVYVLGTSGLLHPSVHQLLDRPNDVVMARRLSRRRITVLALALLTPPVLMLWSAVTFGELKLGFLLPVSASLALSPLVLTRLGRLVRQNEELASMETTLRSVGERLVSADSTGDVVAIITAGAEQVLRSNFVDATLVLDRPSGGVIGDEQPGPQRLQQVLEELPPSFHEVTGELISVGSGAEGHRRTAGLIVVQREIRGVLLLSSHQPLSAEERNAVTTLCRESAIAFRAVEHTEQQVRKRSEDRFAALVDNSSDIVAVLGAERGFTYVSPVVQRLLGYSPEEFLDTKVMDLVHADDRRTAERMLEDIRFGLREASEVRLRDSDGQHHWFEMVGVDLTSDPNIGGIVLNAREVTDRKEAEERLVLSEARFKALVQNSTDLVVVVDEHRRVRYASPSVAEMLDVTMDLVLSRSIDEVFRDSDVDWKVTLGGTASGSSPEAPQLIEFTFHKGDEQWRTIETTITDLRAEPAVRGFVLNARDISERKNMEQRLRYQATHDELTGLANRVHVIDDLAGMLGRNSGATTVAAILIGIDNFKEINDSLGHAAGDEILIDVAGRITSMLGFGDIAARVGGDEYVVVLERAHGENHVTDLAEQILTAIGTPHVVDGHELSITASAGIVFDHDRTHTAEILLRNADIAMYRAKTQGTRQIVVFEPHMHTDSFDRLQLRADLVRAIEGEQFVAHYQPVVDIASRRIVGAEALIRWQHPERGLLGPNLFIPLAEETGLIGALGEWILERACRDLVAWRNAFGEPLMDFTMSVNLSVQQLHDERIVTTVSDILERTGLPAQSLVLEVTESTLITDTDRIRATMTELRNLGTRLAVDDFGTGYSSLGYIQQFEFDVLKIDKSFVDALEAHTNRRIVTAVLELARQLEVRTIAEGIESELQADILQDLGCTYGQGYLYSRPVAAASFSELLVTDRSRSSGHARL
jgi:diguanylate cyclase (GGDEF)-like protein/PAS domain S-box-containing protein